MGFVRTLKKRKNGLIVNESFESQPMNPRLRPNATYSYGSSDITLLSGEIVFDLLGAENCVVEIENDYIAQEQGDYGGLRIKSGLSKLDFVEYFSEYPGTYLGVKIVKSGNTFQGKGSNDLISWVDRGSVSLSGVETISVVVGGSTPYVLRNFKAYESEYVNIFGTLDGWKLYINDEYVSTSKRGEMVFRQETYPFEGNFKIYEGSTLVCECNLTDIWGGDDYECTLNVDILNEFHEVLPMVGEDFLGNLDNGYILRKYYLRNNSNASLPVTLRVAEYSPFYDWVWLSFEEVSIIDYESYHHTIETVLDANEEVPFYLFIKRPDNAIIYDYENKKCKFFLEVV